MLHVKPIPTPMCIGLRLALTDSEVFKDPSLYRRTVGAL